MNQVQLIKRIRSITRDLNNATFSVEDIADFINEGIERVIQVFPEFSQMGELENESDEPLILPRAYHNLLSLYGASRCFLQDERHYQASNLMNEFEEKLESFRKAFEMGRVKCYNVDGSLVTPFDADDFVVDDYFEKRSSGEVFDVPTDDDVDSGSFIPSEDEVDGGSF